METIEKVRKLVAEQLCISTDEVGDNVDLADLGADSIDVVEMLTALEDEFGVSIPDSQIENLRTVSAIVKIIESSKK